MKREGGKSKRPLQGLLAFGAPTGFGKAFRDRGWGE